MALEDENWLRLWIFGFFLNSSDSRVILGTKDICVENKVRIAPPDYSKENLLATFAPQRNLTPEQIFWSIDNNDRKKAETSVPKPLSALTVYPPNTPVKLVPRVLPTKSQVKINLYVLTQLFTEFDKTCKKRITPTGVTEGERGFEQTKRCYLTEVIPFFKTLKEHFAGVQTALFKEVKVMEGIFDQMSDEVDQNAVDKQCAEIVKKNLLIENENLIANCLSNQLLYDVEKSRCLDLEAEKSKVQNEIKHISKLERENLNLQLKYQHLQESFDNNKSQASQKAPDFHSFFKIKNLEHQIQEKDNVIRDLKVLVSNVNDKSCEPSNAKNVTALLEQNERFRAEIEKVKQHYKELFESITITRASTNEKTSSLLTQIEDLKAQLEGNLKVSTRSSIKTKVLAPGMYAIDVEPIPPHLKNNRSAHLDCINHLKESVESHVTNTVDVGDPRLANRNNSQGQSSEGLLCLECWFRMSEYLARDHLPKRIHRKEIAGSFIPLTRKAKLLLLIHAVQSIITHRTWSAPENQPLMSRINKSVWTKVNRVDSSISSKRVLNKGKQIWKPKGKLSDNSLNKTKQIWKPKGKLSDNSLNKTKRVWKATGKLFANVGYQWRSTGKKVALGKLNCGYQWRPTGKKFALGELCPLTKLSVVQIILRYLDSGCSKLDLEEGMAPVRISSGPEPIMMTPGQLNSGLAPSPVPATTYIPPTDKDLEILFQPMFDEYFDQSTDSEPVPTATVVNAPIVSTNTSVSTMIAQDAPSTSHSLSSSQVHPPVFPQGVAAGPTIKDTLITQADLHPSVNPVAGEPSSVQSTSRDVSLAEPNQVNQPPDHLRKWTKDHPLDNIVVKPKNFKMAVIEDCWFQAMQDEIHEFDQLENRCSIARIEASRIFIANGANQEYEHLPDGVKTAFSEWDLQEEVPLSTLRI
ncbi:hypothetical protein Tco_1029487 [Tanacetum coccineum]|uniref:Uncharacterized protein n=1 Tax=Tanacetum coccineum TaxID=301880 RepID=A0ABQ5G3K2_9ASTR